MWSLIKYEFKNIFFAILFLVILTGIFFFGIHQETLINSSFTIDILMPEEFLLLLFLPAISLPLAFAFIGALQMFIDRFIGLSTFLSTQPLSRRHIFLARLIAGVSGLALIMLFLVMGFAKPIQTKSCWPDEASHYIRTLLTFIAHMCLAGYSLGLWCGLAKNIFIILMTTLLFAGILVVMAFILGPSFFLHIYMASLVIAALIATERKFQTMPL